MSSNRPAISSDALRRELGIPIPQKHNEVKMEYKVGDKVLISSTVNKKDELLVEILEFPEYKDTFVGIRRDLPKSQGTPQPFKPRKDRIIRKAENKDNMINISRLFIAVKNCSGANDEQRNRFMRRVTGGKSFGEVSEEKIILAVKNWGGGCDTEKEKFLQTLDLTMKEKAPDPQEEFTLTFTREQLERIWALGYSSDCRAGNNSGDRIEDHQVYTIGNDLERIQRFLPDHIQQSARKRFNK